MNEGTRKGLGPQITQMDADEEIGILLFRICVNLRDLPAPLAHFTVLFHSAIPVSVAAGCAGIFAVFCGNSSSVAALPR